MDIKWLFNRFRKMSLKEIKYRLKVKRFDGKIKKGYTISIKDRNMNFFHINKACFCEKTKKDIKKYAEEILSGNYDIFNEKVNLNNENLFFLDQINNFKWDNNKYSDINIINKVGDAKIILEINKQQYLLDLALAYMVTNESKYYYKVVDEILRWINDCNNYIGPGWKSGLEIGLRCLSWMYSLSIINCENELKYEEKLKILDSLIEQADFVYNRLSLFSSANNHLVGEAAFLLHVSFFVNCNRSDKWRIRAIKILNEQINNQFFDDGVNKEQSINYQLHTMELYFLSQNLLNINDMSLDNKCLEILKNSCRYILCISEKDGSYFNIGDEDGGEILRFRVEDNKVNSLLSCAEDVLNVSIDRKLYSNVKDKLIYKVNELEKFEVISENNTNIFRNGGMLVKNLYFNNKKYKISFDFGECGLSPLYAHAHSDLFSFNLNINGKPIFIDCGTYKYHNSNGLRDYFRSSIAHNTISINEKDHIEFLGNFMCNKSPKCLILDINKNMISCFSDSYKNIKCGIFRTLEFNNTHLLIKDRVENNSNKDVELKQYFNLDSTCRIHLQDNKSFNINNQIKLILGNIDSFEVVNGDSNLNIGLQSPRYNILCNTNIIITKTKVEKNSTKNIVTKLML
ncbi:alginate lyase family protein [Clostridium perfringens]|nr:alginate lyase family protein [Clostridium perfringens]MDU1474936.1 alginate lyase family protein [Clostridium perfringens]